MHTLACESKFVSRYIDLKAKKEIPTLSALISFESVSDEDKAKGDEVGLHIYTI